MHPLPVFAAVVLAMSNAFFGVVMSRMFWAEDLKHVQQLRQSWDRQKNSMESTIGSLERTIKAQSATIEILKGETK